MGFKKANFSISPVGFIGGLTLGIVIGAVIVQTKSIKQDFAEKGKSPDNDNRFSDRSGMRDSREVADHLAYLGNQAEQES